MAAKIIMRTWGWICMSVSLYLFYNLITWNDFDNMLVNISNVLELLAISTFLSIIFVMGVVCAFVADSTKPKKVEQPICQGKCTMNPCPCGYNKGFPK